MMDYGPDWPPPTEGLRPRRRRRRSRWRGFGLGTNIMILVGTAVICAVMVKLADRPMELRLQAPRPAAGTISPAPR